MSWFKAARDHVNNLAGEMTGQGKKVSVSHFPRRCGYCLSISALFRYYRRELTREPMLWWAIAKTIQLYCSHTAHCLWDSRVDLDPLIGHGNLAGVKQAAPIVPMGEDAVDSLVRAHNIVRGA